MAEHDERSRTGLEQISNGVSRHRFLNRAARGVFATVAALALGNLGVKTAFAGCWGALNCCGCQAVPCSNCSGLSGPQQCPTNWSLCTGSYNAPTCNSYCYYPNGYWSCPGPNGAVSYCTDCRQGSGSSCTACTCNVYLI